jgi:hypothetical protein
MNVFGDADVICEILVLSCATVAVPLIDSSVIVLRGVQFNFVFSAISLLSIDFFLVLSKKYISSNRLDHYCNVLVVTYVSILASRNPNPENLVNPGFFTSNLVFVLCLFTFLY